MTTATRRLVETALPTTLLDHLEQHWPDRRRFGVANSLFPEGAEETALLDYIEQGLVEQIHRQLAEHGLTLATSTGPVWTRFPCGENVPQVTLEQQFAEIPWTRGEPVYPHDRLICRVTGLAIPPLTEEPRP